jgi:IS1 family transposase
MNRLSIENRARILSCLAEGNSLRATARMCDVSLNTVSKLLEDVGYACAFYQAQTLVNLPCKRIQCDEIWSFCHTKEKNTTPATREQGYGDIWTWTALCADTKLMVGWYIGNHGFDDAKTFLDDLRHRLANRVQLSTDGFRIYLNMVEASFHGEVDYAMLVKRFGQPDGGNQERKYSPQVVVGTEKHVISGNPDEKHISTSYVERQNLTMRMSMRRFTRLTNAFSRKCKNHAAAIALRLHIVRLRAIIRRFA